MLKPLVSIIIPCYNAERYIAEAIDSALGQTYPHREVIVIDDGSTDSSLSVIQSFGDAIRWESGPNEGGGAARNRGLKLAKGELIQFLDADDVLRLQKLERQLELTLEDPSRIVYCDYATEWESGYVGVAMQSPDCDGLDPVEFILKRSGLQTSAPLHWRQHLLRANGFREELRCSQERDLHLRLACLGLQYYHLPEILYTVRRRTRSVSSDWVRVLDQHESIAWWAYELLECMGTLTEERRAALAGFLACDGRVYLRFGLKGKGQSYFRQARRMHSGGGLETAYSWRGKIVRCCLGPSITESLARLRQRWVVSTK